MNVMMNTFNETICNSAAFLYISIILFFSSVFMKKSKTKKQGRMWFKLWYIVGGLLILIAVFLYLKIVYFPSRSDISDIGLPLMISEGDMARARKIDIEALSSFTGDYIVSSNTLTALENFYHKTHDEKVALSLVQMYISHYQFDDAFSMIKDIYHDKIDFSIIPAQTFLYVLFNSAQLSPSNYALIDWVLEDYKSHVRIDDETYTLYRALLSVYKDDTNSFYKAIETLSGSKQYERIVAGVHQAQKAGEDLTNGLPSYVDALSAVTLLQEWYFRVAQKRAVSIRQKDPKYVLPYQILAQAALLQSHWQEAAEYFDTLLKLDATHPDEYHFGLCASYFWQWAYDNSLLHCQQVKQQAMSTDALRYTLLSYYQMKNRGWLMDTFQLILNKQKPSENDYYTFFDVVFFQPFVTDKDFSPIEKYYVSVILPYLNQCVTAFGANSNVCRYGQAGFYLYKNNLEKVYKDLLYLASRHPSSYVFRALGEYYRAKWEEEKSKAYYLRAMSITTGAVIDISSAKK